MRIKPQLDLVGRTQCKRAEVYCGVAPREHLQCASEIGSSSTLLVNRQLLQTWKNHVSTFQNKDLALTWIPSTKELVLI